MTASIAHNHERSSKVAIAMQGSFGHDAMH